MRQLEHRLLLEAMALEKALPRGSVRDWMACLPTAHEDERYKTGEKCDREDRAYGELSASAMLGQTQKAVQRRYDAASRPRAERAKVMLAGTVGITPGSSVDSARPMTRTAPSGLENQVQALGGQVHRSTELIMVSGGKGVCKSTMQENGTQNFTGAASSGDMMEPSAR